MEINAINSNANSFGAMGSGTDFASSNVGAVAQNAQAQGASQAQSLAQDQSVQNTQANAQNDLTQPRELSASEQREQMQKIAEELNKQIGPFNVNVKFGYSEDISGMYVSVSEASSGKSIRQIPSQEAIDLAAKMKEIVGMIFDVKA